MKSELPPLFQLINLRKEIDNKFKCHENYYCVYNDLNQNLISIFRPIVNRIELHKKAVKTINLKLGGDGTLVGCYIHKYSLGVFILFFL